eukprot:scpid77977/ scgid30047/ Lysosome-associated membrane glycoprotein 1; CD107 antigen-like family member A; Chromaffin granule-associated membrane glycoprotein IIA
MASTRFLAALLCLGAFVCARVYSAQAPYYVVDADGKACLLLNVDVSFSAVNTTKGMLKGTVKPAAREIDGSCAGGSATATLSVTNITHLSMANVTFGFELNRTSNVWAVNSMSLSLWVDSEDSEFDDEGMEAGNATVILMAATSPAFYGGAGVNDTYQCNAAQQWTLMSGRASNGQLSLANFTAHPFNVHGKNSTSATVTECDADKTPATSNVVPIAVGAALCGLVLIVLVAYIIGRSRHQRTHRGYQSV